VDEIPRESSSPAAVTLGLTEVYDRYFFEVVRWCRAMGAPQTDVEDLAQEVFVVVGRKLHAFDGRNLPGWLYRITSLTVQRSRRRPWYKYLFARRDELDPDAFAWVGSDPLQSAEMRETQAQLMDVLSRMSEKRRTAFILFEIEGLSGEEMAELLDIPLATVWTRLYHARKEFVELSAALRKERER
jgi:RNA polymerase sigma-70 factor (ECF subfamily)